MKRRLLLIVLPVVVTLIAGACSADPTPTSTSPPPPGPTATAGPTATPTRAPTPTPTPLAPLVALADACEPSDDGTVYEVAQLVVEDGQFELRMGSEGFWRYDAEARVSSRAGSGILMTVETGDTIRIGTVRASSSRSTVPHGLTVAGLGIDIELAPGDSQENVDIVACDPGRYVIDDYRDAGTHGLAEIVVEKPAPEIRAPIVFEIDEIVMEDNKIELRIGSEPNWGYGAKDRLSSTEGDGLLITVRVGDSLSIGAVRQSEDRSTRDHFMTIEGLGIDIPTAGVLSLREAPDADRIVIFFDTEGTFAVDDSSDPGTHGTFTIVVEESGVPLPIVYEIDEIVMEDNKIELRIGSEPYWGYAAKDRLSSTEGSGLLITGKVGDSLSIGAVRQSEDRSTKDHFMTIEGLGIDIPTAGVLSLREAPDADRIVIRFDKEGTFAVDDSSDPGTHGTFTIIVEAGGVPAPVVYEIDEIVMEDNKIELRIGSEPYWGYAAKDRLSSTEGSGLLIELNVGDSLSIGAVRQSEDRSTKDHTMTIEGLGIDIPTAGVLSLREAPDADRVVIVFDKAGTFAVDDSSDPGAHGTFTIIVKAVGGAPTTYEIDEIVMEDNKIELRIGTEPYWGYAAKDRLSSTEGDGLLITLNVGDSLSIGAVRQSDDRSTIGHHMTIEGIGIDIPTEGVLSLREAPGADRIVITFDTAGTFFVDDSVDPGTHGKFEIIVE